MKLTFENVIEAYLAIGYPPVDTFFVYIQDREGTPHPRICGLSALAMHHGVAAERDLRLICSARPGPLTPNELFQRLLGSVAAGHAFMDGFDGDDHDDTKKLYQEHAGDSFTFIRHYEIGARLGRLFFEKGLSPQEVHDLYCRKEETASVDCHV